jgi:hypothetical protein
MRLKGDCGLSSNPKEGIVLIEPIATTPMAAPQNFIAITSTTAETKKRNPRDLQQVLLLISELDRLMRASG